MVLTKMATKKFLFQEALEELLSNKKVTVTGDCLAMVDNDDVYKITPAVKFLQCETNESDPLQLVGKIAPYDNLNKDGAEIFLSSVIYKKESYKIQQGYICCSS